ncbi:MAG: hypothetical protein M1402_02710 [Candidatus Thermoplasmatota archaeon]|nr:hypothetical protein [Candidatus Thermoplasmatota archaeon]
MGRYRQYNRYYNEHRDEKPVQKRIKKLDMRKTEEFQYLLSEAVSPLPESVRGAIKGSIYSIASKKGAKEAKDFIQKKNQEGLISSQMEKDLIDLVFSYSRYR